MSLFDQCQEFEDLMEKHSDFGAREIKPRSIFKKVLYDKIVRDVRNIPKNAHEWDLLFCTESEPVAKELTESIGSIIDSVDNSPYREVKDVINWYNLHELK